MNTAEIIKAYKADIKEALKKETTILRSLDSIVANKAFVENLVDRVIEFCATLSAGERSADLKIIEILAKEIKDPENGERIISRVKDEIRQIYKDMYTEILK